MTTVLVAGAGAVGSEAVRQLTSTPGVERVLVADLDADRQSAVRAEGGDEVEATSWTPDEPLPRGVTAVVAAVPGDLDGAVVARALEARVPAASAGEDPAGVERLLDVRSAAAESGVPVIVGAGLAPGLSEVLVAHAVDRFDEVDEVHVARTGAAGPASRRRRRAASWGRARELDRGAWVERAAGSGRRLVYFPEPVGPYDCVRVASAVPRLVSDVVGSTGSITSRDALRRSQRLAGLLGMGSRAAGLGALCVEVRGRRGAARDLLTLGAVDHVAVVAGTVLAVATAATAGLVAELEPPAPGAGSPGRMFPARAFLAELARRGVRVARFEGDAAA